jgi:predicted GNAT family acetyltransferase
MVLDNPAWTSLTGAHAHLAIRNGPAARYPAEVGVFAALAEPSPAALEALAEISEPGDVVGLFGMEADRVVAPWQLTAEMKLIQMVCETELVETSNDVVPLSAANAAAMLTLAEATQPGPFGPRTIEMGRYVGQFDGNKLIAMAGERLKPDRYTEVSAVCTDPAYRGQGRADTLVRAIGREIQRCGETAFLHVAAGSASETIAVGVYERLGFVARTRCALTVLQRT